jgi:serine/threonine protein kinase
MKYYDMAEIWEFGGGDPEFLYTNVIFRDGDDYFWSQQPKRDHLLEDDPANIDQSLFQKIPPEHIWPRLEDKDKLTICQNPHSPDVYIKQPQLTRYNESESLSKYLLQEAHICQFLMEHPHENVARYLGCVVKDHRITGLCFQKYAETLGDRLQDGRSVDNESCLEQVRAGIDHLHHTFNLVHNDIHLDNVMFVDRDGDALVIIDFDSCAVKGDPLPDKRGQMPKGACTAEFENDSFGLDMLWNELNLPKEA